MKHEPDVGLKSWGGDRMLLFAAAAIAAFTPVEPVGFEQWVTSEDYDEIVVPTALQDSVRVALSVGSDGKVFRCTPILVSESSANGYKVCRLLQRRARFKPARDIDGATIPAVWTGSFRIRMYGAPGNPLPMRFDRITTLNRLPSGPAFPLTEIAQVYSIDGKIQDCRITKSSGLTQLDALACASTTAPPIALLDVANRPMRAVVNQTILFAAERRP